MLEGADCLDLFFLTEILPLDIASIKLTVYRTPFIAKE